MKKTLLFFLIPLFFSLKSYSQIGINQPTDYEVCDDNGDEVYDFDLTIKDSEILNGLDPVSYELTYHLTFTDATNQTNALSSPYTNTSNPETIYARVFELSTGNYEITNFNLRVNPSPVGNIGVEQILCGVDGFAVFDLTQSSAVFMGGEPNLTVSYFLTAQDAITNVNAIANPQAFTNTTPYFQTLYVRVENDVTGCSTASSNNNLYLNVSDVPNFNSPSPLVVCDTDNDGFEQFDLFSKNQEILGQQDPDLYGITYHETLADAESFSNAINQFYTNIIAFNQTIYVRIRSYFGNCYQVLPLDLVADVNCISLSPVTMNECSESINDIVTFDLTALNSEIVNGADVSNFLFSYFTSQTDAEAQINEIANPTNYMNTDSTQTIHVRVEEIATDVNDLTTITLNILEIPEVISDTTYTICDGQEVVLNPAPNSNGNWIFDWSTFQTTPEIVVSEAGIYTVEVRSSEESCSETVTFEVVVTDPPSISEVATDLTSCEPNAVFDLTSNLPEILNGLDASQFIIGYFNDIVLANTNNNAIASPESYSLQSTLETIYVRVQNLNDDCYSISSFNISTDASCPLEFSCEEGPITNTFCYENNTQTQYIYQSTDGTPLQVNFIEGIVENNWDELVILDSDGVTNLNPSETTYGNNGDLSGLVFTSSGDNITIFVQADGSVSCQTQNYTSITYEVSCVDTSAIPDCLQALSEPLDGAIDVSENVDLSWSPAVGFVTGYTVSLGLTSGGTEVLDNVDVGAVYEYDLETLDYETTYYVTVVPYNTNGPAENCNEFSFTTRANPNQTIICQDGPVNTTYCYGNNDTTEFNFQSSDGQPLTVVFNAGGIEVNWDELYVEDSDGTVLNPDLPYGNGGDFAGLTYTSTGDTLSIRFDTDGTVSCSSGSSCCTAQFDFDVFCASSVGFIQVNAFVDANTNNVFDANEFGFTNGYFTYEVNGDGVINTVNSSTGSFQIISANETDSYDITFNLYDESEACYDITTTSFNGVSVATGSTVTVDFPVVEEQSCEDLAVYLINNWAPPRPGFTHNNYLYLENLGFTTIASGSVEFALDSQLILNNTFGVNSTYTITNTANGFTVDFVNLQPGEVESIGISMTCPVSVTLDDIVTNTATYLTDTNDLVPDNNYSTLSEVVVGSWDPNDKMEVHGPEIVYDDFVVSDEWLYYTIRFQNLGTAEAIFVRIEDALNAQLDESTFQMLRSSHDFVVTRTGRDLEWYFDNINLPAEQDDAAGSIGFVYFRIKPLQGYAVGDIIPNTAAIYFDFNAPVITNRFDSEFVEPLSVSDFDSNDLRIYPNPATNKVTISLSSESINDLKVSLIDIQGKEIIAPSVSYANTLELDLSALNAGLYFVRMSKGKRTVIEKLIVQ